MLSSAPPGRGGGLCGQVGVWKGLGKRGVRRGKEKLMGCGSEDEKRHSWTDGNEESPHLFTRTSSATHTHAGSHVDAPTHSESFLFSKYNTFQELHTYKSTGTYTHTHTVLPAVVVSQWSCKRPSVQTLPFILL